MTLVPIPMINTGENHRLDVFEAFDRFVAWVFDVSDGVADLYFRRGLDTGDDITYVTSGELVFRNLLELKHAYFVGLVFHLRCEEFYEVILMDCTVEDTEVSYDAAV